MYNIHIFTCIFTTKHVKYKFVCLFCKIQINDNKLKKKEKKMFADKKCRVGETGIH